MRDCLWDKKPGEVLGAADVFIPCVKLYGQQTLAEIKLNFISLQPAGLPVYHGYLSGTRLSIARSNQPSQYPVYNSWVFLLYTIAMALSAAFKHLRVTSFNMGAYQCRYPEKREKEKRKKKPPKFPFVLHREKPC